MVRAGLRHGRRRRVADVTALAIKGSELYVGGSFTEAGGVPASLIAKWNGSSWSALGNGLRTSAYSPGVKALVVCGDDLYAGGDF